MMTELCTAETVNRVVKGRTFYRAASVSVLLILVVAVNILTGDKEGNHRALEPSFSGRHLLQSRVECREVNKINSSYQCQFIKDNSDCDQSDGFIPYNEFIYCTLNHAKWGGTIILIIWWLFMFTFLAVCADDFFCPSLVVITKTLRLSANIAGVTFLAFGNGAADVFSAIAANSNVQDGNAGMGIGGILGAGIFVNTVVVCTIAVLKPFKAMERPFLRDVMFYLFGVYWTFFILWKGWIHMGECIAMVLSYGVYVSTAVIAGSIYKKQVVAKMPLDAGVQMVGATIVKDDGKDDLSLPRVDSQMSLSLSDADSSKSPVEKLPLGDKPIDTATAKALEANALGDKKAIGVGGDQKANDVGDDKKPLPDEVHDNAAFEEDEPRELTEAEKMEIVRTQNRRMSLDVGDKVLIGTYVDDTMEKEPEEEREQVPAWKEFLYACCPIALQEWPDMPIYAKIYEAWKSPVMLIQMLTCPAVRYEIPDTNGWNRHLSVFQCLTSPTICVMLVQVGTAKMGGVFPVYGMTLIIGFILAVAVFFTSKNYPKPVYHWAFGYGGFAVAMVWIYVVANEIVNILKTFGNVFNISNAILGLTLLAWGNSVADWIANAIMARQGYPRMAFAACFGASFLNLTIGLGLPFMISMKGNPTLNLRMTGVELLLTTFTMGTLLFSMLYLLIFKFQVNRPFGICLLVIYLTFLIMAILTEAGVILKDFKPTATLR